MMGTYRENISILITELITRVFLMFVRIFNQFNIIFLNFSIPQILYVKFFENERIGVVEQNVTYILVAYFRL